MLNLIEKLQYYFSVLILFVILVVYLLLGGAPESRALLPKVKLKNTTTVEMKEGPSNSVSQQRKSPKISREDKQTIDRVKSLARKHRIDISRSRTLTKKKYDVPKDTYEVIREKKNWIPQLNKAASSFMTDEDGAPSMLELEDIEEGSFFEKFGLENGDQIALVNGDSMNFDPKEAQSYYKMAEEAFEQLESGGTFSVTVLRGGKPVQIEFSLEN